MPQGDRFLRRITANLTVAVGVDVVGLGDRGAIAGKEILG
jgi:hypothetical protein